MFKLINMKLHFLNIDFKINRSETGDSGLK